MCIFNELCQSSVTKLLHISWRAGVLPTSWKMANICPLFFKVIDKLQKL